MLRAGPFDSKRYAFLAQGKLRVESMLLHFGFRISDFENGERVESPFDSKRYALLAQGKRRAGSSDRVRWLFDLVDFSNRGRRNGFPGKILPDFL